MGKKEDFKRLNILLLVNISADLLGFPHSQLLGLQRMVLRQENIQWVAVYGWKYFANARGERRMAKLS